MSSKETMLSEQLSSNLLYDNVEALFSQFKEHGYELYAVGGCIRNFLLNKPPKDIDFCTNATPEQMREVMSDCGVMHDIIPVGEKFGTLAVRFPETGDTYEITCYRDEGRYTDNRHPDSVSFAKTVEEDLSRRDFTCNAIAWNPEVGIVDPYGGVQHIRNRVLRCVGDADERFKEDALRIVRLIRFSLKYHLNVDPYTLACALRLAPSVKNLSMERLGAELEQILNLKVTTESGVLALLCKVLNVIGVDYKVAYNALTYTQPLLKWSELFPFKPTDDWMPPKMAVGKKITRSIANLGRAEQWVKEKSKDGVMCKFALSQVETEEERLALLEWVYLNYEKEIFDILVKAVIFNEPCRISDLAVNGYDIMERLQIEQGKEVKELLHYLLFAVLNDPNRNNREYLLGLAQMEHDLHQGE